MISRIDYHTFSECSSRLSIRIPASVQWIFYECRRLVTIIEPDGNGADVGQPTFATLGEVTGLNPGRDE
jgi:hypothetical protein